MSWARPRAERVRVALFPQSPLGSGVPQLETVELSTRTDRIGDGPSDDRMYTIGAPRKLPYGRTIGGRAGPSLPPWRGLSAPPLRPSLDGHLDRLDPAMPGFREAHVFGCARFALDVWEGYLGAPLPWHFEEHFRRLEIITLRGWANAHMGYGYLEVGERPLPDGTVADLALDFDVVGHEIGHAIVMTFGGPFAPERVSPEYEAFHEASADWAALIASLHFDSVVNELLETTRGDLDGFNRLNRFAEFSRTHQIRLANNRRTMWDFALGFRSEHELALPVIAGFFDIFVELYHEGLLARGAISPQLDHLAEQAEREPALRADVRRGFDRAFTQNPEPFYDALIDARDIAAIFLLGLWRAIKPTEFRFVQLAPLIYEIDRREFAGSLASLAEGRLTMRGIGVVAPGPRLSPPDSRSHVHSERTLSP